MKKTLLCILLIIFSIFAVDIKSAFSQPELIPRPEGSIPKYYSPKGLAIRGYDPVAYFVDKSAKKGLADLTYEWNSVIWRFSSEANRNKFVNDPYKYAPQYGGYCALAAALGYVAKTEPKTAWTVYNGKLYLHYNSLHAQRWSKKKKSFIKKAEKQWSSVLKITSYKKFEIK